MTNENIGGATGTSGLVPPEVERQAKADIGNAMDTAKSDLEAVRQKAVSDVQDLKQQAKDQLGDVTDKAKSFAGEQKDLAAGQLSGIASAITKVADELEGGDQGAIARYARDLANGIDRVSNNVKDREVDDLVGMAQDFGRTQPMAFLGAAALAGFVASRFALASAHRRETAATQTSSTFTGDQSNNYRPQDSLAYPQGQQAGGVKQGGGTDVGY